jgi:hypothetical protein
MTTPRKYKSNPFYSRKHFNGLILYLHNYSKETSKIRTDLLEGAHFTWWCLAPPREVQHHPKNICLKVLFCLSNFYTVSARVDFLKRYDC